jgi:hypothetical protein
MALLLPVLDSIPGFLGPLNGPFNHSFQKQKKRTEKSALS